MSSPRTTQPYPELDKNLMPTAKRSAPIKGLDVVDIKAQAKRSSIRLQKNRMNHARRPRRRHKPRRRSHTRKDACCRS